MVCLPAHEKDGLGRQSQGIATTRRQRARARRNPKRRARAFFWEVGRVWAPYLYQNPMCGYLVEGLPLYFYPIVLGAALPLGAVVLTLRFAARRVLSSMVWGVGP